jgi:Uma2 family endonuclease
LWRSFRLPPRRSITATKLSGYFSLPSVQHYLILDPERRVVIHHKRGQGETIETRVLTGGVARLDPPGFEVAVEALFPLL